MGGCLPRLSRFGSYAGILSSICGYDGDRPDPEEPGRGSNGGQGGVAVAADEELVEEIDTSALAVVSGVVALALEVGAELEGGLEEPAALAHRLEGALIELNMFFNSDGLCASPAPPPVREGVLPPHAGNAWHHGGDIFVSSLAF